ncbi:hypothetical protein VNO77_14275 [Canavalia gladiata]|uniref:Uncharacterized protein n=1 Tax=Canavalia gladiata TaxID=3824 RepID=A0AAN9LY25_CANGL
MGFSRKDLEASLPLLVASGFGFGKGSVSVKTRFPFVESHDQFFAERRPQVYASPSHQIEVANPIGVENDEIEITLVEEFCTHQGSKENALNDTSKEKPCPLINRAVLGKCESHATGPITANYEKGSKETRRAYTYVITLVACGKLEGAKSCLNHVIQRTSIEVFNFSQDDLLTMDVLILDTYAEMFIGIGQFVDPKEKQNSFEIAQKYIDKAASLEGLPPHVLLYEVIEGNESCFFTTYFSWDYAKAMVQGNSFQKKGDITL